MTTIGALTSAPGERSVYRRADGDLYCKLNDEFHVKTKLGKDDEGKPCWLGDGSAEQLDPSEEVEAVE